MIERAAFSEDIKEEVHAPNGGLVDTVNLDLLKGDQASVMINCHHDRLGLEKRLGRILLGTVTPDITCFGGYHYRKKDAVKDILFRVNGGNLYKLKPYPPPGPPVGYQWVGAVSEATTPTSADLFGNGVNNGTWIQYADNLYYFDGGATRKYWRGSTSTINTTGVFAGVTPPAGTIEGKLTGGSLGAGTYKFVYTWYNPTTAEESNPSDASNGQVTVVNDRISCRIPKQTTWDPGWSTIRLYRTAVNGATYFFDHEVTGISNAIELEHYVGMLAKKDEDLGAQATYDAGPIPKFRYCVLFQERIVATGNPDSPSTVYWSAPTEPTKWPTANALDIEKDGGDPITGIFVLLGRVYVLKQTSGVFMLVPTTDPLGVFTFAVEKITSDFGCLSHHSIVLIETFAYWADTKGICRFNGQQVRNISDAKIRQTWKTLANQSTITRCFAIHDRQADHQYYRLTVENPPGIYADLIYDATQDCWFQDTALNLYAGSTTRLSWLYKDSKGQYHVIQGDATGRCFRLRTNDGGLSVYDDAGHPIAMTWRSKDWGGIDGLLPLYVDIEYERSVRGMTNMTFGGSRLGAYVQLYRNGNLNSPLQNFTAITLYDQDSPAPADSTDPAPFSRVHSVRIPFDAEWARRFSFDLNSSAVNSDFKVTQYRVGYKEVGPMLRTK